MEKPTLVTPKSSNKLTITTNEKEIASVKPSNTKKSWLGYATLSELMRKLWTYHSRPADGCATESPPASAIPITNARPTSGSFGDILIITSPKTPTANCPSLAQSPTSDCSVGSPITPSTPYTPVTPPPMVFQPSKTTQTLPGSARPLLGPTRTLQTQPKPSLTGHCQDPYTHLVPRVTGLRMRRYTSPPRHLRVTIPDRNTKPLQHSHRRLPSDVVITAPPRVLARSISELVGGDGPYEESPCSRKSVSSAKHDLLAKDRNSSEVGRLGW